MPWPRVAGAAGSSLMFFVFLSVLYCVCFLSVLCVCVAGLLFCVILSQPFVTFSDDFICLALNSVNLYI